MGYTGTNTTLQALISLITGFSLITGCSEGQSRVQKMLLFTVGASYFYPLPL